MTTRKILTEAEARDWFDNFGESLGKTFEDIFGKMNFDNSANARSTYKTIVFHDILFIKIRDIIKDEFNCSPEVMVKDRFIIAPQYYT